jgi:hypothetical protein
VPDLGTRNDYNERPVFLFLFVIGQYLLSSFVFLLSYSGLSAIAAVDIVLNRNISEEFYLLT